MNSKMAICNSGLPLIMRRYFSDFMCRQMFLLSPFDSESTITSPNNSGIQCSKAQNYSHIIFLSPGTTTIPHEFHIKTGMEYRKRLQMLWLIVLVFTFFLYYYPPLLPSAFSQTACVSLYRRSLLVYPASHYHRTVQCRSKNCVFLHSTK